jgi:hypothetical protein
MAKEMQARFRSKCANRCGRIIEAGETILFDGRARHANCQVTTYDAQCKTEVEKVTAAVAAGQAAERIIDGIREDETLDGKQVEVLCAYAEAACAQRDQATYEERTAAGECGGNVAECQLATDEWVDGTRRQANRVCA